MTQLNTQQSLYFNKTATTYNKNMHVQYEVFTKLLSLLDTSTFETITDIGCGTGIITKKLHEHFNSKKTLGFDQSSSMIDHAKSTFETDTLTFQNKSAYDFSSNDQAELIFSNATLQWLPDLNKFFSLLKNQIKKPTTIAFSIFLPETYNELATGLKNSIDPSIIIPAERFESFNTIEAICNQHFTDSTFSTHHITHSYKSIMELLTIIKQTGSKELSPTIQFTKTKLSNLEEWFLSHHNAITASYKVALGIIRIH